MKTVEEQIQIIQKGVVEIIDVEELREKLKRSYNEHRPLTVKLGLDPTAPDIHLGHAVVLRKIKQLQDLGHKVVIIIGDFTGMIGDPTGKSKTRKAITRDQVLENATTYEEQIFRILDKEKTEVRFNSQWLAKLDLLDVIQLTSKMTVARMLEREDFKNRFQGQLPIFIHEFFYPLMQAYDSVEIKADIELGGTDQRFNLLTGRMLQKEYDQEAQVTIFMPLLEGIDGKEKMSKSLGNYIGIDDTAEVMYEKVMSIPDSMIIKYFELVTDLHPSELNAIKIQLLNGDKNPRDIKMNLSKEITTLYHGKEDALKAEIRFIRVYQEKQIPMNMKTLQVSSASFDLARTLLENNLIKSKSELRRLATQGGLTINNEKKLNIIGLKLESEMVIQLGKKTFIKILEKR
ncbi:MAG: tyrosine--tRNA ligase [Clostridiaceae bacterium]|nr:tyrosine--tRNA ligase [Clostridiaceae bacterium]